MLNRNMTNRMISVFKMSIKKMVDFARLFHITIVLSKYSKSKSALSAVCDCGISRSFSLTIIENYKFEDYFIF